MTTTTPAAAVPAARYARGVQAGSIAELFGLGPDGVRWPQVLVVTVGTWFSGNTYLLERLMQEGRLDLSPAMLFFVLVWPAVFVFCAITSIRSFQSGPAVATFTGALYAVFTVAIRYATYQPSLQRDAGYWVAAAANSFAWPTLTMFALQFAVRGANRWSRMAVALTLAAAVEGFLSRGIHGGSWDVRHLLETLPSPEGVRMAVSAVLWTVTFRIGLGKFGRR